VRVGFYNTFNARSDADEIWCDTLAETVEVSRDVVTGDVHALRGDGFWSVQFHPESILSEDGVLVLDTVLTDLLRPGHRRPPLQRQEHQPLVDTHPLQRK
jgi:phenazine biosynthesis protein phzE